MGKDYYKTLNVEKGASKDDVKRAFRKLAHEHHPDKGGDEAKFKEINEAYQVLSDEKKRSQYDQFGQTFDDAGGPGGFGGFSQGFEGVNFEDLGDIFGDFFGGGGRRGSSGRGARGSDIQVDVSLKFKESIFGVEKEISIVKNNPCERCAGIGAEPGSSMNTCGTCDGSGVQVKMQRTILGAMHTRVTCEGCSGRGETPDAKCSTCTGSGIVNGRQTLRVDIPPGVEDGVRIRVRNQGESIGAQGASGDLYLRVHVDGDPRFHRHGSDIIVEKTIGFSQAALGDELDVETVDGKVALKIPAGTRVPSGRGRGDQIVVVTVKTPKKLSRKQRKLLEDLELNE